MALIGAALTCLGVWSAAVADRIRGRRAERSAPAPARDVPDAPIRPRRARATPRTHAAAPAKPPHKPMATVRPAPADPAARREVEIRDWIESMGYATSLASAAARRAVIDVPQGPIEQQIRAAMAHLPAEN